MLLPFRVLPSVFRWVWEEEEDEEDNDDEKDDDDEDDEEVSSRLTLIWTHAVLTVLHKTIDALTFQSASFSLQMSVRGGGGWGG